MTNSPRYLITTADERTWKFDRPVIFLGEWCRAYDRRHVWSRMDAITASPYGMGQSQKDNDYAQARDLEEQLFPVLCDTLNQHHHSQHDQRFWRIVLGHWLRRYIDVIFNRVRTLEKCLGNYRLSGTTALADKGYSLAPLDSYAAIWAFNDDRWNNTLYLRILNFLGVSGIPVELISTDTTEGYRWRGAAPKQKLIFSSLKWGYRQARVLAGLLARDHDAFIINSYLPRKEAIKLQLALGQVPQFWISPALTMTAKPDTAFRNLVTNQIIPATGDTLYRILVAMLFQLLPVCYLEGFQSLAKQVRRLPWPKVPKLIFTSNNFDSDEVFKLWTAKKVESGIKYVAGQHGNNYGTHRYMFPALEESTADRFLTWGWKDGLPQHTPTFILKTVGRGANSYDPEGGLLLIEVHMPHRITIWDGTFEFAQYFSEQEKFIRNLGTGQSRRLTVRLHGSYTHFKWDEENRWREIDPSLKIDIGTLPIEKLIARSRLIVHSYDSTGILETLSQNIPTMAFWQNGLEHLRDSAKPYYQLLVDAGIVHLSPESAAAKINDVWENVEGWWAHELVQSARAQFCHRYAKVGDAPIADLKKALLI